MSFFFNGGGFPFGGGSDDFGMKFSDSSENETIFNILIKHDNLI